MTALDDQVGIGADQWHGALLEGLEHVVVIFRRLRLVIEEAGADDGVRLGGRHDLHVNPVQQ
ncbi:hypothetical protein D3C85_1866120 [compost metagenome]